MAVVRNWKVLNALKESPVVRSSMAEELHGELAKVAGACVSMQGSGYAMGYPRYACSEISLNTGIKMAIRKDENKKGSTARCKAENAKQDASTADGSRIPQGSEMHRQHIRRSGDEPLTDAARYRGRGHPVRTRRSMWKSQLCTAMVIGGAAATVFGFGGLVSNSVSIENAHPQAIAGSRRMDPPSPVADAAYAKKAFRATDGCYEVGFIDKNPGPNLISVDTAPNCPAPVGNSYVAGSGNFYKSGTLISIDVQKTLFVDDSSTLLVKGPLAAKLYQSWGLDSATYSIKVTQNAVETLGASRMPWASNANIDYAARWDDVNSIPKAAQVASKGLCYHLGLNYYVPSSEIRIIPQSTCPSLGNGYYKPGSIVQFILAAGARSNGAHINGPYQLENGLYGFYGNAYQNAAEMLSGQKQAYGMIDGTRYGVSWNVDLSSWNSYYIMMNKSGVESFGVSPQQHVLDFLLGIEHDIVMALFIIFGVPIAIVSLKKLGACILLP